MFGLSGGVFTVIVVIVAIVVVLLVVKSMWKVAEPNEALIISGGRNGNPKTSEGLDFKIVTGKGTFVLPVIRTVRRLDLSLNEAELEVDCVTQQGIKVVVKGVVIFKVGDTNALIANAARRFLGGNPDQLRKQVYNVFEGHLRSIIGSMTVEQMIRERNTLAENVRAASGDEMAKLGLVVDSLQIKDFKDDGNYITNLAKPHQAAVERDARIAQADNNRQAAEAEARAAATVADARSASDIQQSAARANAEQAMAEAAQAGPLADATARQKVVVQETEIARLEAARQQERLNATLYKDADAAAYQLRTEAAAKRDASIANAEAEARKTTLAAEADAARTKITADAVAHQRTVNAQAEASATKAVGEASAAATRATGGAEAEIIKAKGEAEGAAIKARAEALREGQEAVINQQLAEKMPEIVAAIAAPLGHIGQLTVLNGAEGVSEMFTSVLGTVGSILPMARTLLASPAPSSDAPSGVSNGDARKLPGPTDTHVGG